MPFEPVLRQADHGLGERQVTDIFRNYIKGRWQEAAGGRTFERRNPATGDLVGTYTMSGPEDVAAAATAAGAAFRSWRLYPAPKRGELLFRAAQLLVEHKERLA